MRIALVLLLTLTFTPALATAYVQEPGDGVNPPPPERPAPDVQQQDPDDRPPPPPPPPGQMDRRRPPGRPMPGAFGRGAFGGPPGPRPQAQFNALIRLIAEQRPDLAERLEHLRRTNPERFRNVLAEALIIRLEHILGDERPGPERRPGGFPLLGFGPGPEARFQEGQEKARALQREHRELEERAEALERELHELEQSDARPDERRRVRAELEQTQRELAGIRERLEEIERHRRNAGEGQAVHKLQRRHEELERRSHDLAAELRELRERGEQSEQQAELMEALARSVNEHFDLRTELREFELRRIHGELEHLRKVVEEMRGDLERRGRERDSIVERRVRMLLGEDTRGW